MPAEKLAFPGRNYLYAPGPTHIPVAVQNAMVVPMEDHRAPDFPQLVKPILRDLNKIFQTKSGQSFVFPATGTAGWEVALTNTLSPGDRVLTARFGQFSHLWADLAQRMGLDVQLEQVTWGEGVPVERFRDILRADKGHRIKAVLVCHNETATGVTSDVAALRRAMDRLKHPALLMVDGVSSIASIDFRMDGWKVDVAVSGSQKGFMLPAGMAMVCFSRRALAAAKKAECKRCFLDIADHIATNKDGFFPYTPSAPMLRGLRASLDLLLGEGLPNVFKRHRRLAEGRAPGGARRLAAGPVRGRAEVVLRHGQRDQDPARRQCRRGDPHRLPPLQHLARRGAVRGRRQGVPHRPPGRQQRSPHAGRPGRGRDGHARRRDEGQAGLRRGQGGRVLLRHRAPDQGHGRPRLARHRGQESRAEAQEVSR